MNNDIISLTSRRIFDPVRRLGGDQGGAFAVMFAISAVVMLVFVGMGIDYLDGLSFKSRWDTAADSAALAAIHAGNVYIKNNAASQTNPTLSNGAIAAGVASAMKSFNANAGASAAMATVTPAVSMTVSGTNLTANVTYAGTLPAHFGGLVGINSLSVSGSASATESMTTYINYYFIVDVSQSMGIGATATDMQNLYDRTRAYGNASDGEPGCVFGCHVQSLNGGGNGFYQYSNEYLAHQVSPYITLRIDAAKTAIQNVIAQAQQAAGAGGNLQFGLYTISSSAVSSPNLGPYLNTVTAPTSNFSALQTLTANIDLANASGTYGYGDTDFSDSLGDFNSSVLSLAPSGDGLTASSPINYVFLITDGVEDTYSASCFWGHCTQAMDPSICGQLKSKATVGVIYTTYLPVYENNDAANGYDTAYANLVLPIASRIAPNLQACATSSSYYYEATDGPALVSAMAALFASTYQTARLTQ